MAWEDTWPAACYLSLSSSISGGGFNDETFGELTIFFDLTSPSWAETEFIAADPKLKAVSSIINVTFEGLGMKDWLFCC